VGVCPVQGLTLASLAVVEQGDVALFSQYVKHLMFGLEPIKPIEAVDPAAIIDIPQRTTCRPRQDSLALTTRLDLITWVIVTNIAISLTVLWKLLR
jgi:hypothetical protein